MNQAIERITPELSALTRGTGSAAGREVYETILRAMRMHHEEPLFRDFARRPGNTEGIKGVLRALVRTDPAFAAALGQAVTPASMVDSAGSQTVSTQLGNTVHGDLTGRDKIVNANSTTNRRSINTGGLVVAGVVIAALVLGYLLIRGLIGAVSSGSGLDGSSTCQDFLASSDTASKASVMKSLYLADSKPHLAADPFIIQNTEYYCGNAPKITLSQLASKVRIADWPGGPTRAARSATWHQISRKKGGDDLQTRALIRLGSNEAYTSSPRRPYRTNCGPDVR